VSGKKNLINRSLVALASMQSMYCWNANLRTAERSEEARRTQKLAQPYHEQLEQNTSQPSALLVVV
jgi:hypothetical protein